MGTVVLMFACFITTGTCGVIKFIVMCVEYFIREKPPILEAIATGSFFLAVLLVGVLVVMAIIYSWFDE